MNFIYLGSSPGDRSSMSSSPIISTSTSKYDWTSSETNQLLVPPPPSRPYRSKSVDVSLTGLNLEDTKITIDMKKNEITITPTGSKKFQPNAAEKTVHFSNTNEGNMSLGDKISQAFENLQDGLQMLNEIRHDDKIDSGADDYSSKLTIKGPGSYIKKLIQQFSEGPFEAEDATPESDRSIKQRADAICKKCLHYKGKISK